MDQNGSKFALKPIRGQEPDEVLHGLVRLVRGSLLLELRHDGVVPAYLAAKRSWTAENDLTEVCIVKRIKNDQLI